MSWPLWDPSLLLRFLSVYFYCAKIQCVDLNYYWAMSREPSANARSFTLMSGQSALCLYPLPALYSPIQDKHFLNSPSSLVVDSLKGLCAINSKVALDPQSKSINQQSWQQSSSWLVSPSCLSQVPRCFKGCSHVWRGLWSWTCTCGFCRWGGRFMFWIKLICSTYRPRNAHEYETGFLFHIEC